MSHEHTEPTMSDQSFNSRDITATTTDGNSEGASALPPMVDGTEWSRRDLLRLGGVSALMAAAGSLTGCRTRVCGPMADDTAVALTGAPLAGPRPSGAFRLVHFTDIHIKPEHNAEQGTRTALRHVRQTAPDAQLLITGGDLLMDAMDQTKERTSEYWSLFQRVLKDEWKGPVEHCIGNHDIWGWGKEKSKTTGSEPLWGKKWWMQMVNKQRTYGSFDQGPWHIVILDSVQPYLDGYQGGLDDEQFAWLENDLASVAPGRFTLIVSHIPILSMGMIDCDARKPPEPGPRREGFHIGIGAMMMDAHRLLRLFQKHPHVKACLSGHIHIVEHLRYLGIDFFCSGAVCGMWWRDFAANREFMTRRFRQGDVPVELRPARADPGYAVVDLHPDGRVTSVYHTFAWTPSK